MSEGMTTITVRVTQNHIDKGFPGSCSTCPLALAMSPHIKMGWQHCWVGANYLHYASETVPHMKILLPREARAFRKAFDMRLPVKPFTFEIDVPNHIVRTSSK